MLATSRMKQTKLGHVRFLALSSVRPSPENDQLYRPVNAGDPDIAALAESVRAHGVMEPLVVTLDGWILSGHRRYAAARLAGRKRIPCRVYPIRRRDDLDGFLRLLREYNRQREKTLAEKLREEVVSADPEEAHESLMEHRRRQAFVDLETIEISGQKTRARITSAKEPMLNAILEVLEAQRDFWPLSDRRIHYSLLNNPPLRHARKPDSVYRNDLQSYKSLVELLTRARLEGTIPMNTIADETRPVTVWDVHQTPQGFLHRELDEMLKGYARDLLQSQPNHIEILGEKNTLAATLRPVASEYCIPLTLGRGFCSLPPRHKLAKRFRASGKDKLILLVLSDFDPDGEEIAHSFARSMRDDFYVEKIQAVKVALTAEQVEQHHLPPFVKAKPTSPNYRKFVDRYGEDVFELEALEPQVLQQVLRQAVDAVLDLKAFNAEIDAEKADAAFLETTRRTVLAALKSLDLG